MNRREFIGNGSILSLGIIFGLPSFTTKTKVHYYVPKTPAFIIMVKDNHGKVFEMTRIVSIYRVNSVEDFFKQHKDKNLFVYNVTQFVSTTGETFYFVRSCLLLPEYQIIKFEGETKFIEI